MSKNKNSFSRKGFTLVELLVVIAILVVLTSLIMVSFRRGDQETNLRLSTEIFVTVLKQAQTLSYTQKTLQAGGDVPEGGYGVYIMNRTSYVIFGNKTDDKAYTSGASGDPILDTISLPGGIEMDVAAVGKDIVFLPPYGAMYIEGGTDNTAITLKNKNSDVKVVKLYPASGVIQEE